MVDHCHVHFIMLRKHLSVLGQFHADALRCGLVTVCSTTDSWHYLGGDELDYLIGEYRT